MKSIKGKKEPKPESPWIKRLLYISFGCSVFSAVMWLIVISINYWVYWTFPVGENVYTSSRPSTLCTKFIVEKQYAGMWKLCRKETCNETMETDEYCTPINFFPPEEELKQDQEITILNYRRAVVAMALIGVCVTIISSSFTWYAITHPRYTVKRLAGCLLLGSAGCILVAIQLFQNVVHYEKEHPSERYLPKSLHRFGFCYAVSWICFVLFLAAGIVLLVNSRKKKNSADHDDNPVIIGRI